MKFLSKIVIGLIEAYIRITYRPKGIFINKEIQSNKLTQPCILIANHPAYYDPLVMYTIFRGKKTIVIAKDMLEKNWILKDMDLISCDRFSMDTQWIQGAKKALSEGKSVIIFPEGKTRRDGQLNEFKSGFAFLARYTGVPVVSVGLDGNYKFGHKVHYVVDVPETITRTKGVASSVDLAQKCEYFQKKVVSLKARALEGK